MPPLHAPFPVQDDRPLARLRDALSRIPPLPGNTLTGRLTEGHTLPDGNALPPDCLVSTGSPALDRLLPTGGLVRGTLVEWLADEPGSGAATLALFAAAQATQRTLPATPTFSADQRPAAAQATAGLVVVIDPQREFYPPAAVGIGLDLSRLLLVRPDSPAAALWALEQALRSPAVAACWCIDSGYFEGGFSEGGFSERALRRLQLAAETGGSLGLLLRPAQVARAPTWASVRFRVTPVGQSGLSQPQPPVSAAAVAARTRPGPSKSLSLAARRRLRVEILRGRGLSAPVTTFLELVTDLGRPWRLCDADSADEASALPVVPRLAAATALPCATSA